MTNLKDKNKEEQETKKIKFTKEKAKVKTALETTEEVEEISEVSSKKTESFEEWSSNFIPSKNGKGALLMAKQDIRHIMKIPDNTAITISAGENLLVLHMFEHVSSEVDEKAIIFLTGEQKCMYLSEKFNEEFTIIHEGTETDIFSE